MSVSLPSAACSRYSRRMLSNPASRPRFAASFVDNAGAAPAPSPAAPTPPGGSPARRATPPEGKRDGGAPARSPVGRETPGGRANFCGTVSRPGAWFILEG